MEETRKTVEKELRLPDNTCERLEALDNLDPEERHVVYKMLGLTVEALPDGSLKVSGAFGEETGVWAEEETSTR